MEVVKDLHHVLYKVAETFQTHRRQRKQSVPLNQRIDFSSECMYPTICQTIGSSSSQNVSYRNKQKIDSIY